MPPPSSTSTTTCGSSTCSSTACWNRATACSCPTRHGPATGSSSSARTPSASERDRALERERVHEGLRQVPAQLTLAHVELLAQQPGRPAGRAGALEPAQRVLAPTLLAQREREQEAAQQERSLGLAERALVHAVAVTEVILRQLREHRVKRLADPRIVRRDGPAQSGEHERSVDPLVPGRPLPAPGGMD